MQYDGFHLQAFLCTCRFLWMGLFFMLNHDLSNSTLVQLGKHRSFFMGLFFTLGRVVISWKSKKQTCITRSNMNCSLLAWIEKADWLKSIPSLTTYCDNEANTNPLANTYTKGLGREWTMTITKENQDKYVWKTIMWEESQLMEPFRFSMWNQTKIWLTHRQRVWVGSWFVKHRKDGFQSYKLVGC